jgi:hypothetical protein
MTAHGVRRLLTLNPSDFARYSEIEIFSRSTLLAAATPP